MQKSELAFYTLGGLVKKNPIKINRRSSNCRVFKVRYKMTRSDSIVLLVKCSENYSSKEGHFVYLKLKPSGMKQENKAVLSIGMKYFCSCPAFLYWGSKYNATKGKYLKNGVDREYRPPDVRDPERKNLICKHIVATQKKLKGLSVEKATIGWRKYQRAKHFNIEEFEDVPYAEWGDVLASMERLGICRDNVTPDNLEDVVISLMERVDNA